MNPVSESVLVPKPFLKDETVRWSCRRGEYALWVSMDSFVNADCASSWSIRDFWQMRDGDCLTITNRWADLPPWFEPHPSEVADRAADEMMKRLDAGYQPKEVMGGPNLWRAKTGDRLVLVSVEKPIKPVRQLIILRACALVLGENSNPTPQGLTDFGVSGGKELHAPELTAVRAGFDAAVALGVPRELGLDWRFGA